MSVMFWQLFVAAVLTFGLVAYLTVRVLDGCLALYRRWACRREMARMKAEREKLPPKPFVQGMTVYPGESVYIEIPSWSINLSREQLEGLATAQDKAERRIVH